MTQAIRQPGGVSRAGRSPREYPVIAEVEYKLFVDGKPLRTGRGWTVTLSSTAVLFEPDETVAAGNYVELLVAWPALLNGKVGLRLWIRGLIGQVDGKLVTVEIIRYEYRTRRLVRQREPAEAVAKPVTASAGAA
jgi:hypothetical protein